MPNFGFTAMRAHAKAAASAGHGTVACDTNPLAVHLAVPALVAHAPFQYHHVALDGEGLVVAFMSMPYRSCPDQQADHQSLERQDQPVAHSRKSNRRTQTQCCQPAKGQAFLCVRLRTIGRDWNTNDPDDSRERLSVFTCSIAGMREPHAMSRRQQHGAACMTARSATQSPVSLCLVISQCIGYLFENTRSRGSVSHCGTRVRRS